jgi:Cu(I)/Ag(I) efflux system membrane fusion protein
MHAIMRLQAPLLCALLLLLIWCQPAAAIQTTPVSRNYITKEVILFGGIEYDPGYFVEVEAITSGIIDEVVVRRTGQFVKQDEILFYFMSPLIYELQLELLDIARQIPGFGFAQRSNRRIPGQSAQDTSPMTSQTETTLTSEEIAGLQRRYGVIRFRLRSLGLYDADINTILSLGQPQGVIPVRIPTLGSSVGGIVLQNAAATGRFVNSGEIIMTIADTHFVWCTLNAFEEDYAWLRFGQKVSFSTTAWPGEVFTGTVETIEPVIDGDSQTFRIGVNFEDKERRLRPGMLVRATVQARLNRHGGHVEDGGELKDAPLVVPVSAVLNTGRRDIVYVKDEDGFSVREVRLGPRGDRLVVVQQGLAEGEEVAVQGSFIVDPDLTLDSPR